MFYYSRYLQFFIITLEYCHQKDKNSLILEHQINTAMLMAWAFNVKCKNDQSCLLKNRHSPHDEGSQEAENNCYKGTN